MSLYRELTDTLPYDPTERAGLWGYRGADAPLIARMSLILGFLTAVALATGGGVLPRLDWGAALFGGLACAVLTRGLLLAWRSLATGGWQAWRQREANSPAIDAVSVGVGIALALLLVTGGGGVGPSFLPAEAIFGGLVLGIACRALLTLLRWP